MSDKSGIEWTDATWNPVVGCTLVSPGCTNCYAMGQAARIIRCAAGSGWQTHYEGTVREVKGKPVWTGKLALAPDRILLQPLRWKAPRRIFVNSMGDLFHEDVPDEWIDRVFAVMALAPQHTFQILTKRAARMRAYVTALRSEWTTRLARAAAGVQPSIKRPDANGQLLMRNYGPFPLPNVWLGVSAEDQARADERVPELLATPAAVRFVSAEPLLGPIDFGRIASPVVTPEDEGYYHSALDGGDIHYRDGFPDVLTGRVIVDAVDGPMMEKLDWIIVGGESGPGARPMHPDWARSIRDQCAAAGTAFFHKQWGEWASAAVRSSTGEIVFRRFDTFEQWVNKASTWVAGGICLDCTGRQMKIGADFMAARDEGRFPVTVMHRVGKLRAGHLLDGVEHNAMPEAHS